MCVGILETVSMRKGGVSEEMIRFESEKQSLVPMYCIHVFTSWLWKSSSFPHEVWSSDHVP